MTTGVIRWGQEPLHFEVTSSDRAVLERMALVTRPWRTSAARAVVCRWRVEAAGDGWEARCEHCQRVLAGPSRDWGVRAVEFCTAQAYFESPAAVAIHGALVTRGDRGLLIVGRSETGKSTLACSLWARGGQFLGDDVTLLDPAGRLGWSAPRRVSLRFGSHGLLGHALWERILATPASETVEDGVLFHPDEVDGLPRPPAVRLRAVALLDRRGQPAGPEGARIEPAHALLALLPYTSLRVEPGAGIRRLRPLADTVPVYDLGRAPLPAMTDAAERLLAG